MLERIITIERVMIMTALVAATAAAGTTSPAGGLGRVAAVALHAGGEAVVAAAGAVPA